jgi:hypothetical protein
MPDAHENSLTRAIHKGTLSLLLVAIAYAGIHFFWQTLEATVYCGSTQVVSTEVDHFRFKTNEADCYLDGKDRGVQYYPAWESWVFLACLLSVLAAWGWFVWRLVRKEPGPKLRMRQESDPSSAR